MIIANPLVLLLYLLLPIWGYFRWKGEKKVGILFSSIDTVKKTPKSIIQLLSFLPSLFRVLAFIFLVLALARPQYGKEIVKDINQGIAMYAVIDCSSSMEIQMKYHSEYRTRLDIVKEVFHDFIFGNNENLQGRTNDLVGIISFAGYANTLCPLTLSRSILDYFLKEEVKIVTETSEDGTAIGDALALAMARLHTADEMLKKFTNKDNYKIKSKILILLTDGEENAGRRTAENMIPLAKQWGIKIYAIGINNSGGFIVRDGQRIRVLSSINTNLLKKIAKETGGIYRTANDEESLLSIYNEIDQLEKSEVVTMHYVNVKEIFWYFALLALLFLFLEVILRCTIFRTLP